MKKTMIMMVLLSAGLMAKTTIGAKAVVLTVGMMVAGVLLFPGLIVGDAQWQRMTDKGICNSTNYIYTVAPMIGDKQPGKMKFIIPCDEWFAQTK